VDAAWLEATYDDKDNLVGIKLSNQSEVRVAYSEGEDQQIISITCFKKDQVETVRRAIFFCCLPVYV
jgi:hypothetical protein